MKLVSFSVTNFRSITKAHKLPIADSTILIGKNNEGKSNVLHALAAGMDLIRRHSMRSRVRVPIRLKYRARDVYDWERDFPIQLQDKKPNGKSIFRIEFELNSDEITEFKQDIKSSLNGTLPIEVNIGKDHEAKFRVLKKGRGGPTLSKKAMRIARFIGQRINLNYIPAVRTSNAAVRVVEGMLENELSILERNEDFQKALSQISELQKPILQKISDKITEPLKKFLPQISDVTVRISEEARFRALRRSCEVIINDGIPTSIERKGDGVKSLAAISLLRGQEQKNIASILALEEPESHLHPSAIHRLKNVIDELSGDHQVVITTHCPVFVDRANIQTNIIISNNKAKQAKDVKEIREILGVKASDNLLHARLVLLVEGNEDKKSLEAIFKYNSVKIENSLKYGNLYIDSLRGAGNLSYKVSMYQAAVCTTHAFLDNDEAGRTAIDRAEADGLIKPSDYQFTICNGMKDSEFEDCLDPELYITVIENTFGLKIKSSTFRNNNKWSQRMRTSFLSQGKRWTDSIEQKVKEIVSDCVVANPGSALNKYKRSSIDALISSIENRL